MAGKVWSRRLEGGFRAATDIERARRQRRIAGWIGTIIIDNALVFARGGNRGNLGCTIGALGGLGLLVTHIVA